VIQLDLLGGLEEALADCTRRGLVIHSKRPLAGRPRSRHSHLRFPDRTGTLELSEADGRAWVQVHPRRDRGWASELVEELANR
jgi:hypothetical protein